MPGPPTLRICGHQWLRIVRVGSVVDLVITFAMKGSAFIGTFLIGFVFVILLPPASGQVVVRTALSAFLADHIFVVGSVILMLNMWMVGRGTSDLLSYRFYPISLAKLAVIVQFVRAIHVRYLSVGLAALITLILISEDTAIWPVLITGLFLLLFDSVTFLLHVMYAEYTWLYHAIFVSIIAATLCDIFGEHFASRYVMHAWLGSADTAAFSFFMLLGITSVAMAASHSRIRTLLRYGS